MKTLLRLLFPRTYAAIFSEGERSAERIMESEYWKTKEQRYWEGYNEGFQDGVIAHGNLCKKEKQQFNQKHPRESDGTFKKK